MKKNLSLFLISIIAIILLTDIASAEDTYRVTFTIETYGKFADPDLVPPVLTTTSLLEDGSQVTLDLKTEQPTVTITAYGADGLTFSFDTELELPGSGIALREATVQEKESVQLKTRTMDYGALLTITWTRNRIDPLYQEIIDQAAVVLSGYPSFGQEDQDKEEDFSVIFHMNAGTFSANMGYTLTDLDGNGVEELLFGENIPDSGQTIFYDLYTIQDGKRVHVFDGWDRNRYYICTNGVIVNQGSNSAFESYSAFYSYANGNLRLMQSVIYNALENTDSPWYLSETDRTDITTAQNIEEYEANLLNSLYTYRLFELQSFNKE